jgi:hypothetical protein
MEVSVLVHFVLSLASLPSRQTVPAVRGLDMGPDSSVGIATRYGLDGRGIESRLGTRFSAPVQTGSGVHPASYTVGSGAFHGVKWPGHSR